MHADATNFGAAMGKEDVYKMLLLQARGILDGQRNWVCLDRFMIPRTVIDEHVIYRFGEASLLVHGR